MPENSQITAKEIRSFVKKIMKANGDLRKNIGTGRGWVSVAFGTALSEFLSITAVKNIVSEEQELKEYTETCKALLKS